MPGSSREWRAEVELDQHCCPCGSPGEYDESSRSTVLEVVELEAQDDGRRYSFRGALCKKHADSMRAYWRERFGG